MEALIINEFDKEFLALSWKWLNDPEIRQLTNTPDFTIEAQKKWFDDLAANHTYKVWGISFNNKKIGVVGLKNINFESAEYFGYIGEKSYWNKGLSRYMIDHALMYAKSKGIFVLRLRVLRDNQRAIRAYEKYGFKVEQNTDSELLMRMDVL